MLHILCIVLLLTLVSSCLLAAGLNLGNDNETSDANGNHADIYSSITWAKTPSLQPYIADSTYDEGNLEAFMNMMNSFINTIIPKDPDYEFLKEIYKGDRSLEDSAKELGIWMIGYGICLVIGILFMIIFPVVGCGFCCCRLCGNCGGKRVHKNPSECKCVTFTIIMDAMVTCLVVGISFTLIMNDRMSRALNYTSEVPADNLKDVSTFLDNILTEIDYYAYDGFAFAKTVIERDLNYSGNILGEAIQDYYGMAGLYDVLDNLENMADVVDETSELVNATEEKKAEVQTSCDTYNTEFTGGGSNPNLESELDTYLDCSLATDTTECNRLRDIVANNFLQCSLDVTQMQDLSSTLASLNNLQDQDMRGTAKKGRKDFDDIPELVTNNTKDAKIDVDSQLNDAEKQLNDSLAKKSDLEKQKDEMDKLDEDVRDLMKILKEYDDFRRLGFYVITLLVAVISIFWILPLCCSAFCYRPISDPKNPPRRHCCSECCGCMMMAGAGLAWIFSTLLMLCVMLPFMVGAPMEKIICQPLLDPDYKLFNHLDGPGGFLGSDGYYLSEALFNNGSIELTLSVMLEYCRNNGPIWKAFKLENLLDLNTISDELDDVNMTESLSSVNLSDVSNTNLMSDQTEQQLKNFSTTTQEINFTALITFASQRFTVSDVPQFITDLKSYDSGEGSAFPDMAAFETFFNDYGTNGVQIKMDELKDIIKELNSTASGISTQVDSLTTEANKFENEFAVSGADTVNRELNNYADRLLGVVMSYKDHVLDSLQNEMGRCLPVWNAWYTIVHVALCKYTLNSWNGFWFALGWCVFTMFFSTIFSIKLSKFYRRMKPLEDKKTPDEDKNFVEDEPSDGNQSL